MLCWSRLGIVLKVLLNLEKPCAVYTAGGYCSRFYAFVTYQCQ